MLRKKNVRLVFFLWAISVTLLCIGSLINFHQNKIWGKPLISQFVAVKREAGKTFVKNTQSNISFSGVDSSDPVIVLHTFSCNPHAVILLSAQFTPVFKRGQVSQKGLRAPPAIS